MEYKISENEQNRISSIRRLAIPRLLISISNYIFPSIFLFALCLLLLPWQQTAKGTGRVIAYSPTERQQTINAPVEGRPTRWFVQEGSVVKIGDPIVEITDNDPEILERLRIEKEAIERRLNVARKAVKTSLINVNRQKELFEQGLSSRRAFEQAELEYARYLSDEASSSAELSRIEVRLARQSTQLVKAQMSGTILRRMSGEGTNLVKSGDAIAILIPSTKSRAVELYIDGNDLPLITEKRKVRLQFEGWPAVQFSGWPNVAVGTFGGVVSVIDASDNGEGKFRILIIPDMNEDAWPDAHYLRQGVRVNGWVLLNQVSLGYELWRQFNGFPPLPTIYLSAGTEKSWEKTK